MLRTPSRLDRTGLLPSAEARGPAGAGIGGVGGDPEDATDSP